MQSIIKEYRQYFVRPVLCHLNKIINKEAFTSFIFLKHLNNNIDTLFFHLVHFLACDDIALAMTLGFNSEACTS